jgi:hypothetical protein
MKPQPDFENLVQNIGQQIQHICSLMEAQLPFLEEEINRIMDEPSRSGNEIAHLLDTLLDFGQMGVGEELFFRLLGYYKTVDAEAAEDYRRFYEELKD